MCGIAGIYESHPSGLTLPLAAMLRSMLSRGPDDQGASEIRLRDGGVWHIGACRLAILDLSPAGHQPMRDPETGNQLVFNGEIYNFRELRSELESRGCRFRSNCDTEVLLLGYREWGEGLVERLRGMFAFGVWDQARQTLLLGRDRHGVKPLYYAEQAGRFLFASELRALLASGLVERELDATGLDSFLKFGAVQEPATMIRGIRLLPAGHILRHTAEGISIQRYWQLPRPGGGINGGAAARQARIGEIREVLAAAVRMRLVSDVPLGIFLSGGLDSSVVAAAATALGTSVKTFTVAFSEQRFNEGIAARRVAAYLGTEHHEITLSQRDLIAGLPRALSAMDQPTVDGINTYFVSQATKQAGVTVALSGLGGDEVFAGYRSFRLVPRMERADLWAPEWLRGMAGRLAASPLFSGRQDRKLAAWLCHEDGFGHPFYLLRMVLTPPRVARLLRTEWLMDIDFDLYAKEMAERARLLAAHDSVNRVACLELAVYLRNTLLRDTDCMSMAHSLEVRVPLLDHLLTEQVLRLPGSWKLDGRQRKPLLVAAVAKPLPQDILRLPKRGFEFPWSEWLRGQLRPEVDRALADPGPLLDSVLRWEKVRELWAEFLEGRTHWSRPWMFYVLKKWVEQHLTA